MNLDSTSLKKFLAEYPNILLSHGSGGKLTNELFENILYPAFKNNLLGSRHDGAVIHIGNTKVAFTTDSFVVKPIFFPGGDIGKLAVNGTINDLAMCGAKPLYISCGLVLEEGFLTESLGKIIQSMKNACDLAGVQIVTGDTKVVDKSKGDGVYINTSGIGIVGETVNIEPRNVRPGDVILLSGDIGRHGVAIMGAREGLTFDSNIESDSAPLNEVVEHLLKEKVEIHCLRDLTRGGLGTALVEIAHAAGVKVKIEEENIPVRDDVQGVCEILGLDPIYVANEGRFVAFVPEECVDRVLAIMKKDKTCEGPCIIGNVVESGSGLVVMKTKIGANRIVDMLSGLLLPRIC
jgi:hydrogenase expression/formation protein HypE